jgi:hypothetical protein
VWAGWLWLAFQEEASPWYIGGSLRIICSPSEKNRTLRVNCVQLVERRESTAVNLYSPALVSWLSLSALKYIRSPSMRGATHTWLTHPGVAVHVAFESKL